MTDKLGTVYWVTGLSGAGKTTIGTLLYKKLKQEKNNVVLLDGDQMRKVFAGDLGYSQEDRYKMAMRYARLCEMLSSQGIDVVCCTISMFDGVRNWNRENIQGYQEVYLKVSPEVLLQRDQKGLYSGAEKKTVKNVMGMDIQFEEPKNPNVVVENNGHETPEEVLTQILSKLSQH